MYKLQTTNSFTKVDRRISHDRRKSPTPLISRYSLRGGRRYFVRRKEDRRKYYFVDIYSKKIFFIIISILILNIFDCYLSLALIKNNIAVEANPLMASYLNLGEYYFIIGKIVITSISIIILCIFKNLPITKFFLGFSIIIYLLIVIYELGIILKFKPNLII